MVLPANANDHLMDVEATEECSKQGAGKTCLSPQSATKVSQLTFELVSFMEDPDAQIPSNFNGSVLFALSVAAKRC